MKLTLQQQVALIYTRAGSMRKTAAELGISHQKVGRILRAGQPEGPRLDAPFLRSEALAADVSQAFERHKKLTRAQAKADGLPFDSQVPIFARRMEMQNGAKGDRVEAMHLHWLPDSLRYTWLKNIHKTGKYYTASIGSVVNLKAYNRLANAIMRGAFRDPEQLRAKKAIMAELDAGLVNARIQTPYTAFDRGQDIESVLSDIIGKTRQKHEPATGTPGTVLADRVLLQVDTRAGNDKQFRKSHPYAPKPDKAPGNRRRAKPRRA